MLTNHWIEMEINLILTLNLLMTSQRQLRFYKMTRLQSCNNSSREKQDLSLISSRSYFVDVWSCTMYRDMFKNTASLVQVEIFMEIKVSVLMIGQTHEDIYLIFSRRMMRYQWNKQSFSRNQMQMVVKNSVITSY
ncbi:hypothetical protein ACF0H5_010032 [Mactra antiquata]